MQTRLTEIHVNTLFEYCHASVNLDNVDILYLENGNVYRPRLKHKTATIFFLKKLFLVEFLVSLKISYNIISSVI